MSSAGSQSNHRNCDTTQALLVPSLAFLLTALVEVLLAQKPQRISSGCFLCLTRPCREAIRKTLARALRRFRLTRHRRGSRPRRLRFSRRIHMLCTFLFMLLIHLFCSIVAVNLSMSVDYIHFYRCLIHTLCTFFVALFSALLRNALSHAVNCLIQACMHVINWTRP